MKTRFLNITAIVVLAVSMMACANRNIPPQGQVALRGDQVVNALRAVLPAMKGQVCTEAKKAPCISVDDARKVADILEKSFVTGEALGRAVIVYDNAATEAEQLKGREQIRALLNSLAQQLATAQITPGDEAARAIVVTLLASVTSLLLAFGGF